MMSNTSSSDVKPHFVVPISQVYQRLMLSSTSLVPDLAKLMSAKRSRRDLLYLVLHLLMPHDADPASQQIIDHFSTTRISDHRRRSAEGNCPIPVQQWQ